MTKLTKSNLALLLETIDTASLPATIRDAVEVCEKLGERYLWVDRFCIVQDDDDDKFRQIQAMSAIFSGTKLVIVAAAGSGMGDGLGRH